MADLADAGIEFLVVPHRADPWLDGHPDFLTQVEELYPAIARREHLCTVYELNGHARRPATRDRGDEGVAPDLMRRLRRAVAGLKAGRTEHRRDV